MLSEPIAKVRNLPFDQLPPGQRPYRAGGRVNGRRVDGSLSTGFVEA